MSADPDKATGCPNEKDISITSEFRECGDNTSAKSDECKKKNKIPRSVRFPEEEQIVTQYFEPANPWHDVPSTTKSQLAAEYLESCRRHNTPCIDSVLQQIRELPECSIGGGARAPRLTLGECSLTGAAPADALEAVMRKVQFRRLELEHATMDDEGAEAMFDMIEYYESAAVVCISGPRQFGIRGWQAASRMIKKSADLSELEVTDAPLEASHAPVLARSLRAHTCRLRALCLQRVALCGEPLLCLVIALKSNNSIRELRLGDNRLSVSDAAQLASLLRYNTRIQLLDLSNNQIQDAGAAHLADALAEQASQSPPSAAASPLSPHRCQVGGHEARGLAFLVLWNNQLTRNCAPYLSKALRSSNSLCVLNIGRNALGNEAVRALARGGALVSVGLQAARLGPDAAAALTELIRADTKLQRLDLRENRLGSVGLQAILTAMKDNGTLTQIDLDEPTESSNLSAEDTEASIIRRLTRDIRAMCRRNEPPARHDEEGAHPVHRKISLTCHTTCLLRQGMGGGEEERRSGRLRSPAPSPAPSPAGSPVPAPHSRFMVTRVTPERDSSTDSSSSSASSTPTPTRLAYCPPSRFKVVQVMEPPQIQVHPATSQPRKSPSRFSVTRNYDSEYNPSPSPPPPSPAPTQPVIYTQLQNEVVAQLKNEASQCKYDVINQAKCDVTQLKYEVKTKNEATQCKNEATESQYDMAQVRNEVTQLKNEAMVQIKNEPTQIQNVPVTVIKSEVQLDNKVTPDKTEVADKDESEIPQNYKSETITVKNEPTVKKVVTTQVRIEAMKKAKNESLSQVVIEPTIQFKNEVTPLVKNIVEPVKNIEAPIKSEPMIHVKNEAMTQLVSAENLDKNNTIAQLKNETNPIKIPAVTQLQNVPVSHIKTDPAIQGQNEASALKNESVTQVKNVVTTQLQNEPATLVKIESTIQLKNEQVAQVNANVESTIQIQNKCTTEAKSISIEPIQVKTESKTHTEIKTDSANHLRNIPVETTSRIKDEPANQIKSIAVESSVKSELPIKILPIESSSTQNKLVIDPKTQLKVIIDTSKTKLPAAQSILPKSSIPTIEESLTESEEAELCDSTKVEISTQDNANNKTKCENKEPKSDSNKSLTNVQPVSDANKSNAIVEYAVWDLRMNIEPKIVCEKSKFEPISDSKNKLTKEALSDSTKCMTKEALSDSTKCMTKEALSDLAKCKTQELSTLAEMTPLKTEFKSDTQIKSDITTQELTEMKNVMKLKETKSETKITDVISDLNVIDISIKNPTLVTSDLKYSDVVKSDKKVNSCDTKAKVVCNQNKDNAMQNIVAITEDLGNIIKEMQVLVKNRDSLEEIVPADSLMLKKNKSESSLDSPDLEVSRLMEKGREERSAFDSNSSLEISGSSMESLNEQNRTVQELDRRKSGNILLSNESSMESASDATPVNSGNFLNLSLSSNESVSPIFGKTKLIHDSLSSLEASVSSLDSGRQEKIMVTSADSGIEYSLQHPSENRDDNSSNEGTLTNNSSLKETVKKPEGFQLVDSSPKRTSSLLDVPALKNKGVDRMRKISWVAPSSSFHIPRPDEKETKPSHLEKLLSLFQHPSSIFSRSLTSDDEKKSASNTPPRKDASLTSSFWSWGSTIEKNEREEDSSEATDSTLSERVQVSFVDESFSRKLDSKTPSTDTDNTLSEFQSFPTQESECVEERVTITTEDIIVQNLELSVISNTSKQRSEVEAKRSGDVDLLRDKESGQEKEEKELARPRSFAAVLKSSGSENSLDKQNSPDNGQSVDKLPSKVIRGIKENISPENTLTSSMTNTKALAVELERQVKNPTVNIWEVTLKSEPKIEEVKVQSDLAPIATIEEANDEDPLEIAYIDDVKIDKDLSIDSGVAVETEKGSKTTDGIDLGKDALSYLIYENRDFEIGAENIVKTTAQQGSLAQELKDAEIKEILDLSPELVVEDTLQDNVFTAKEVVGSRTSPIIPERAKLKKSNSLEDLSQLQVEEKSSPKAKTIAFKVPESTTPRDIPERRVKLRSRSGSSPKSLPESLNKPCPLTKMESILNKKKKKVSSLGKMARDSLLALNMSEEEIAEFRRSYKLTSVESLKSLESVSEDANSQSGNSVDSRCRACLRTSQESLMSLDSISEDCRCTEDCERPGKSTR